jgi:hypothetical protein
MANHISINVVDISPARRFQVYFGMLRLQEIQRFVWEPERQFQFISEEGVVS